MVARWRQSARNDGDGDRQKRVIAHLIRDISRRYPTLRVLVVNHVLELIQQDLDPLLALWPDAPVGINSAGIGQREWDAPIIFAGVQSVWRNAARLGPRHLVLIDEAHLVPHDGDGMYRRLIVRAARADTSRRHAGGRVLGDAVPARQRQTRRR